MAHEYRIAVLHCEESGVLVATSDTIPGLVLEADTLGGIIDSLLECAPRLIEKNNGVDPEGARFIVMPECSIAMHSAVSMEPQLAQAA